jgi:nucleoside-diphosphate-sugar epimerase
LNIGDIDGYALQNDYGTAMALQVAAEVGISRFLYASSMVVNGEGTPAPSAALFVRRRAGGTIFRLGVSTRCARSAALS